MAAVLAPPPRAVATCALVGNGGSVLDTGYGREIDGADLVLRLKHAMTRGHEADVGARTDVRFVYMPPLPWVKMEDASKGPVTYALTTARGFKWYMGELSEPINFSFGGFAIRAGGRNVVTDGPGFDAHAEAISAGIVPDTAVLSIGARALLHALAWCQTVNVYGFSFFKTTEVESRAATEREREQARFYPAVPYHYYWVQRPPNEPATRTAEPERHAFGAERKLIELLVARGRVRIRDGNLNHPERIVSHPKQLDSLMAYCDSARNQLRILPLPTLCLHHCLQDPRDPFCAKSFRGTRIMELAINGVSSGEIPPAPEPPVLYARRVIAE